MAGLFWKICMPLLKIYFSMEKKKKERILQLEIDCRCSLMAKTATETPLQILLTTVPLAVMRSWQTRKPQLSMLRFNFD